MALLFAPKLLSRGEKNDKTPEQVLDFPEGPGQVIFREDSFDIYIVNIRKEKLSLYHKKPDGTLFSNIGNVKTHLENLGDTLVFACNAGIYDEKFTPKGLFIQDGKNIAPADTNSPASGGNFYLKPNGVFLIYDHSMSIMQTPDYHPNDSILQALQSGPMLVIQGKIHPAFKENSSNTYVRNGVGMLDAEHAVFAISRHPVNLFTFAKLFQEYFHCQNALYLDGAISKMYLPKLRPNDLDGKLAGILAV
ncbi:MAG: hypothetical protein EAZ89_05810, partial [Bacteroidetes bacterium]